MGKRWERETEIEGERESGRIGGGECGKEEQRKRALVSFPGRLSFKENVRFDLCVYLTESCSWCASKLVDRAY